MRRLNVTEKREIANFDAMCFNNVFGCTYASNGGFIELGLVNYRPPKGKCRWEGHVKIRRLMREKRIAESEANDDSR